MHWSKFNAALEALKDAANSRVIQPQYRSVAGLAASLMAKSQRFYLPEASVSLLDGKLLDNTIRDYIRLPYPIVSILSETAIHDENNAVIDNSAGWKITLAFSFWDWMREGGFAPPDAMKNKIVLFSTFQSPALERAKGRWVFLPMFCLWQHYPGPAGFGLSLMPLGPGDEAEYEELRRGRKAMGFNDPMESEFSDDAMTMTQLCLLLAIRNTEKISVPAPEKLNRARVKSGKLPLNAYHVLRVGGDVWDSPASAGSIMGSDGVRSHYRRGHIRNLRNARPIWVRHTTVHGRRPGFVDKDYKL